MALQEPHIVEVPSFLSSAGTAVISALIGFLGAVAVFRARFEVIDAKHEALKSDIEKSREADKELMESKFDDLRRTLDKTCEDQAQFFRRIERRQEINLELMAGLARKAGVSHRAIGVDVLTRALEEVDDEASDLRKIK